MQLIEDSSLLTVGRNTPDGRNGPTQVSLFDVSDLSQPRQVDQYTFERFSTSEAEVDHHAFGYYAEHGLLAIPFSRGYVLRVDEDGDGYRETRQWIQEHQLAILAIDTSAGGSLGDAVELVGEIQHDTPVRRSGYIADKLYSIANDSIRAVAVAEPGTVLGELVIADESEDNPPELWPPEFWTITDGGNLPPAPVPGSVGGRSSGGTNGLGQLPGDRSRGVDTGRSRNNRSRGRWRFRYRPAGRGESVFVSGR